MKKLKKQLAEMQLKYNVLQLKCTSEARQLQHDIEMTIKAISVIRCSTELKDYEILTFEEYKKMFYDTYFIYYYKSKKTGNLFSEKDLIEKYESYKSPLIT